MSLEQSLLENKGQGLTCDLFCQISMHWCANIFRLYDSNRKMGACISKGFYVQHKLCIYIDEEKLTLPISGNT